MKMVLVALNIAIERHVLEKLSALGLRSYTKWPRLMGVGETSGPHLDSHIWPGANTVIAVVAPDDKAAALMEEIRDLRKTLGSEGVKAFLLPVEDVT
jgi:nitrogen regulatory protein PII